MGRIFHIATVSDWETARSAGSYTTSTLGRTLVEEGFIHASRADQWQGVRERFYADAVEPLVLLVIDPDRLISPVVDETPPGADETFPHIYGPLNPDAVVERISLDGRPVGDESFSAVFFGEMFHRIVLASVVMACVAVGAMLGLAVAHEWGPLIGAALGLAVGIPLAVVLHRRRD